MLLSLLLWLLLWLLLTPLTGSEIPATAADRIGVGADFLVARPLLSRAITSNDEGGRGATRVVCASSVRTTKQLRMSPSGEQRGSPAVDEAAAELGAAVDDDTETGVLLAAAVGVRAGVRPGMRGVFATAAGAGHCCCCCCC